MDLLRMLAATALAAVLGVAPALAGTDGKVKIAVLNDMSGPYADASGMGSVVAARMAIDDFGGSVLGQPIELLWADHQNKTDVGSAIAGRWLEVDGVDAIADVPNSGVMLAMQEIVRNKGGVLLVSGGGASKFTGDACSPYGFQWTYDTFALATGTGQAMLKEGHDTWFFLQVDYAFGEVMAADLRQAVEAGGGKVVGSVKYPLGAPDFSSYLVQAQASKAKVVALLNAGQDTINAIKQANEFGIPQGGQKLVGMIFFVNDAKALGLQAAQSLIVTGAFYWAQSPATEAWSQRYHAKQAKMPSWVQIGVYSAVTHYLKAVKATGSDDRDKVAARMREMPVEDVFVKNGRIRPDGRMVHDMLLEQVKSPAESKGDWDIFKILRVIPGDQAFRAIDKGGCPLVKKIN